MKIFVVCLFMIAFSFKESNASILEYIWPKSADASASTTDLELADVPFELGERDEKFLQQATQLIGLKLSDLDMCHHRVILKLKEGCHKLNSEDLGKLAVMLLNCQSAAEGRSLYPCTEHMSLKDCTLPMDPDTWNTYHLVTNRAKAVCYRVRQEQFQGLTELTVNKLMSTAHSQLNMMSQISDNQRKLDDRTLETLQSVQEKNDELLKQQEALKRTHEATRYSVDSNLRELMKEKALIKSGQLHVMELTQSVQKKLDEATKELESQFEIRNINHQEILNDLRSIHQYAQDVWLKIEQTTNALSEQNVLLTQQYENTFKQLVEINSTVSFLGSVLDKTKLEINEKLGWLKSIVGNTGYTLDLVYLIISNIVLLFMLMILSSFINLPISSRVLILALIGINLILALNEEHVNTEVIKALDLKNLSLAIFAVIAVKTCISAIKQKLQVGRSSPLLEIKPDENTNASRHTTNSTVLNNSVHNIKEAERDDESVSSRSTFVTDRSYARSTNIDNYAESLSRNSIRDHVDDVDIAPYFNVSEFVQSSPITPPISRNEFVSPLRKRSNTPGVTKRICLGTTRKGESCKNTSLVGRDYCHRHLMGTSFIGLT